MEKIIEQAVLNFFGMVEKSSTFRPIFTRICERECDDTLKLNIPTFSCVPYLLCFFQHPRILDDVMLRMMSCEIAPLCCVFN